jgi:hypothetical protein
MANIGQWQGDRLEIDMTENSDDTVKVEFGQKLNKDIPNSVQIIGVNLSGANGKAGIRVTNLSLNDPDYSDDYLDILGEDVDVLTSFSETYQTPYAYNTAVVYLSGVSGVTGGKFIIYLNKDAA